MSVFTVFTTGGHSVRVYRSEGNERSGFCPCLQYSLLEAILSVFTEVKAMKGVDGVD